MTWAKRRRAALQAAAADTLAELANRYGRGAIEKALRGRAPAGVSADDLDALDGAQRELNGDPNRIEDVRLQDMLDAAAAVIVGPSAAGERPPLDRALDQMTAAEIDRLGPYREGDDIVVESVEESLPSDEPEPAPARASAREPEVATPAPAAAKAPAEPTPARPPLDFGKAWEAAKASALLGPSAIPHEHSYTDGVCDQCKLRCVHPVQSLKNHRCGICGSTMDPTTCQHYWLRGRCVRCGKQG